ncbi:MAG: excinuclease ABC subunit UvrC [Candidatus Wallbacteria bacterium]|nr:excinuclease ABC subunit UvrC [Candidatus Wallbacteria bacterium]
MDQETGLALISDFPDSPGVYLMKDVSGTVIYIGKAKSLKKRVRQYFSSHVGYRQAMLVRRIAHIDFLLTRDEIEALVLENNLIKDLRPFFNVLLKDDKTYPSARIDMSAEFPVLEKVRRISRDGARYFGPFPISRNLDRAIEQLNASFGLRACVKIKKKPCLYRHLKKCPAPCGGFISREEYSLRVTRLVEFLSEFSLPALRELQDQMNTASSEQRFEEAAVLRDRINALRLLWGRSEAESFSGRDVDYIGWCVESGILFLLVLSRRRGKMLRQGFYQMEVQPWEEEDETAQRLLLGHYQRIGDPPGLVCLGCGEAWDWMTGLLNVQFSGFSRVIQRPGPEHKSGLAMLMRNLRYKSSAFFRSRETREHQLEQAAELLGLSRIPRRIEGYDISTLGGELSVGAMVVFIDGAEARQAYRRFKIRLVQGVDDYAMLREVLRRRLSHMEWGEPDLLLIDGGRGQLSAAVEAWKGAPFSCDVITLAKKNEEIHTLKHGKPIALPHDHPVLRLLVHVRDEAHRFAVGYQRLRRKEKLKSALDGIPGLGPKRRRLLQQYYPSHALLRSASAEELAKIPGFSSGLAQKIFDALQRHPVKAESKGKVREE